MPQASENNKRIAKNTFFLYFRMILMMLVALYTSRVVLDYLGVVDYGLYNVVGGIVIMFSFFNTCMSSATQRFLTFELARGNDEKLKKTFSTALNIHLLLCIVVVILAETIGLFFLNTYLNIPDNRYLAANVVYQCSIATFCVNLIQVPYNATLIAHERMSIYAYLSLLEVFLKLGIVYALLLFENDRLIVYGILVVIVQILIRSIYQFYCKRNYKESRFSFLYDKVLYKEMLGFAGWSMFGSLAWLLRDQGINIVLNIFFGPVINAAKGISSQVSNAVITFVANFLIALNPQITKNYANGKIREMESLTYSGIKYSYALVLIIALPIILNINSILKLWLKSVPEYSNLFIMLLIADIVLGTLLGANPLLTALSATGKIRQPQIVVSSIIMLVLPSSYLILKFGGGPYSVFYVYLLYTLLSGVVRLYYSNKIIGFSIQCFVRKVFIPSLLMTMLIVPFLFSLKYLFFVEMNVLWQILFSSIISTLSVFLSFWLIVMDSSEKIMALNIVKNRILKK